MDGRVESYIVDPEMPPLKDGAVPAELSPRPSDNMLEVRWRQRTNRDISRSPPNIFTREVTMPQEEGAYLD